MVRLAYWLVVMIMVGVTDRHNADEYDDTEPGNIESGDTRKDEPFPNGFARTTLRCNFTTYVGKALQWSIIRRL